MASASHDATLRLWDAPGGQAFRELRGHAGPVTGCAFSPDGEILLSAGEDGTLWLWDVSSGRPIGTIEGESGRMNGCAFSPDGQFLLSIDRDSCLTLWDADTGQLRATLPLLGTQSCLAPHPWQPIVATAGLDGGLHVVMLVAVTYGPIVVTAHDQGNVPIIRCPACHDEQALDHSALGAVVRCKRPGCSVNCRVNPFVI
jgi:WD40 repeat protein